jgi:hypothetical protein
MSTLSENDYIKHRQAEIKEAIYFFSNKCKKDREIYVVRHFLSLLNIKFFDQEIKACLEEPFDIIFRNANFQIKEIYDKGRKRGDEYKQALQKTENATSVKDFLESYSPKMITCKDVASIVANCTSKLKQKYGNSERDTIDLLFYFNLKDVHLKDDALTDVNSYSSQMSGWRSVAVYSGDCALVLHLSKKAPDFLKAAKGVVFRNSLVVGIDD